MSMKRIIAIFGCLINLIPLINYKVAAMDSYKVSLDMYNDGLLSEDSGQFDDINIEDKKNIMNKFKENANWKLIKEILKNEYGYQTADSVDVFSCDNGKTNYILKILPLDKKELFEREKLAFDVLNTYLQLAKKFGICPPIHVDSYKNKKTKVYCLIYEYAGEDKRNSKDLTNEQKIDIWNSIVQQKCDALLFLISKGIVHADPTYSNWIIQWKANKSDVDVKVSLIDFGLAFLLEKDNDSYVPTPTSVDDLKGYCKLAFTNSELIRLVDSLSYDLCDLINISHYESDTANYGIFYEVKKKLDEVITYVSLMYDKKSKISLGDYKSKLSSLSNSLKIVKI